MEPRRPFLPTCGQRLSECMFMRTESSVGIPRWLQWQDNHRHYARSNRQVQSFVREHTYYADVPYALKLKCIDLPRRNLMLCSPCGMVKHVRAPSIYTCWSKCGAVWVDCGEALCTASPVQQKRLFDDAVVQQVSAFAGLLGDFQWCRCSVHGVPGCSIDQPGKPRTTNSRL